MFQTLTRGVLVTLPARLPKMPQFNPKGLSGSIISVQATPVWPCREHLSHLPGAADRSRSARLSR